MWQVKKIWILWFLLADLALYFGIGTVLSFWYPNTLRSSLRFVGVIMGDRAPSLSGAGFAFYPVTLYWQNLGKSAGLAILFGAITLAIFLIYFLHRAAKQHNLKG